MIPVHSNLSAVKLNDVNKLLKKHFGDQWVELDSLIFYKNALLLGTDSTDNNEQEHCICLLYTSRCV